MYLTEDIRKACKDKLIFIDIETSLAEVYTFHIGSKVRICHNQIKKPSRIICISYMVEGWKKPKTLYWDKNQEDKDMLKQFVQILKQYPVVIGQNSDNFDIKMLQGRLWELQIEPIQDIVSLDTLKMSRQNMRLMSHKLDYKSKAIGGTGKNRMELSDWIDIAERRVSPKTKMGPYNRVDVTELQHVFWSLVPYCKRLPIPLGRLINANKYMCPQCGHPPTHNCARETKAGLRARFKCLKCGKGWTETRSYSTLLKNNIITLEQYQRVVKKYGEDAL